MQVWLLGGPFGDGHVREIAFTECVAGTLMEMDISDATKDLWIGLRDVRKPKVVHSYYLLIAFNHGRSGLFYYLGERSIQEFQ
jgi:hypothetical protein